MQQLERPGMKILYHLADVHLGAASRLSTNLLERQLAVLEDIAAKAVKEQAAALLVSGDLFHSPHVPSAVINAFIALAAAHQALPWVLISGTHGHDSFENEQSVYKRSGFAPPLPNMHLLDQKGTEVINGVAFYAPGHRATAKPDAEAHVLLFHGSPAEAAAYVGSAAVQAFDYIALGHYHSYEEHTICGIPAAYPGTIIPFASPKGRDGSNDSSYARVEFGKGKAGIHREAPAEERFVRARIMGPEDLDVLEPLVHEATSLELWGSAEYEKDAAARFRKKAGRYAYSPVALRQLPPALIAAVDSILDEQDDESIPWGDVREAAFKLLSGEEGLNFLKPDKHIPLMKSGGV